MIAAIEKGFPQMEIADAAYKFQRQLENKQKIMVGVNKYVTSAEQAVPLVEIDESVGEEQIRRLRDIRRRRDNRVVSQALADLRAACKSGDNVMPYCIGAVKSLATVQEICDVYRDVYGEYRDPGLF